MSKEILKTAKQGLNFAQKLSKLKDSQEWFEYNLIDIAHPDFTSLEDKCPPVQGMTKSLQSDILNLKSHAEVTGRVNLAANQIGISKRFMVLQKPEYSKKRLWIDPNMKMESLGAFINPRILDKDKFMEYDWEQTACFPTLRFRKARFHHIYVQYFNEQMEQVEQEMNGWESRLFQQTLDLLNGIIPFDEIKNMLDSELLPEYNEDKLLIEEFQDAKIYRIFGKEQKVTYSSLLKGGKNSPADIPETINAKKQSDQPQIFQNKTKKQKSATK